MHISNYGSNVYFLVKSVQLGDYFCLDPYGGSKNDGTHVGLWSGCKAAKRRLIFSSVGNFLLQDPWVTWSKCVPNSELQITKNNYILGSTSGIDVKFGPMVLDMESG